MSTLQWIIYVVGCLVALYLTLFGGHSPIKMIKDGISFIKTKKKKSVLLGVFIVTICSCLIVFSTLMSWIGVAIFCIAHYTTQDKS